jgi:hypothetical protein
MNFSWKHYALKTVIIKKMFWGTLRRKCVPQGWIMVREEMGSRTRVGLEKKTFFEEKMCFGDG